ncbi:MAG: hypothetical protein LBB88_05135 [Planctomycetaceae bacterium]|jgi:hypothetical protein|nr:hypothetical protein [Planctomycetaceae bacterium]
MLRKLFNAAIFVLPFFTAIVQNNFAAEPFTVGTPEKYKIDEISYQNKEQWLNSTFWSDSSWLRIGKNWQHPSEYSDAARTFETPESGNVNISGNVKKIDLNGDGVIAYILHNKTQVWKNFINGNDNSGLNPQLSLNVKKGDKIRFVINRNKNIFNDSTTWSPVVTYPSTGKIFDSTESFSNKQGNGNWRYEKITPQNHQPRTITINLTEQNYHKLTANLKNTPDFNLFLLTLNEWIIDDSYLDNIFVTINNHLNRAKEIANKLSESGINVAQELKLLDSIQDSIQDKIQDKISTQNQNRTENFNRESIKEIYIKTRLLKRSLIFSDPRTNVGEILFVKSRPTAYSHLVGQYFGWNQRPGGGIFALERPGYSLKHRDILKSQLPLGHVLEPRLSYDAKRIAFSYVATPEKRIDWRKLKVNEEGDSEFYYHLYEMDVDGNNLRQLTSDNYDDMMPEYLPDNGIAFVSTRRKAYSRCFGAQFGSRWHSYTLHRIDKNEQDNYDSNKITQLSFNDVSEWFPAVANSGHLWFARWDYIDRDAVTHQNLWSIRPDGTNPEAVWGNASPKPHCMFQAKSIPNSDKIVFIASAHHSITAGPVCVVDPNVGLNSLDAIRRVTPEPFPEAESKNINEYYNSPWALGEDLFLVAYSRDKLRFEPTPNPDNALGLYIIDDKGNREVLYRDSSIGSTCPIPIVARKVPPIINGSKNAALAEAGLGEMSITDIYEGLGDVPRGTLKELRIVQIFPKTTVVVNSPQVGVAGEENTRAVLGVVPIEADGSVKFLIPAGKPILFQVLDENGFAYQTMRSTTSVMSGEQISCIGCHKNKMMASDLPASRPIAFSRPASRLRATPESGRPFGFVETIQPILDSKCVSCHNEKKAEGGYDLTSRVGKNGFTASYLSLSRDKKLTPRFEERNQIQETTPGGKIGAKGSGLIKLLKSGHADVKLTDYELQRIGTWLDLNAIYYGAYDQESIKLQQKGKPIPMPKFE